MLDMLDTHTDMDMLDTMASVRLVLSLRPRLIPIFCMEVMAMAMLDTLAMLDIMDTPMLGCLLWISSSPSLFSSSVTTKFQCLTPFLVTEGRKHRESKCLNKDTACIEFCLAHCSLQSFQILCVKMSYSKRFAVKFKGV